MLDAIAYQRAYQAARTRILRHYGLCVACGKGEAQPGRTRCRRCALHASERTKKWLRKRRGVASGGKAVEAEQGSAVEDDVADLDHSREADELTFVHLIATQQLGVVAKVTQEPVQLPQGFLIAIDPAGNDVVSGAVGLHVTILTV